MAKRTAELSAHFLPNVLHSAFVPFDQHVVLLIYLFLGKHKLFSAFSLLRKQSSPYLLRGPLAYIFSGVLIWTQYVKRECEKEDVLHTEISYISQRNKGFGNLLQVNFV